jgi:hypothetical protein
LHLSAPRVDASVLPVLRGLNIATPDATDAWLQLETAAQAAHTVHICATIHGDSPFVAALAASPLPLEELTVLATSPVKDLALLLQKKPVSTLVLRSACHLACDVWRNARHIILAHVAFRIQRDCTLDDMTQLLGVVGAQAATRLTLSECRVRFQCLRRRAELAATLARVLLDFDRVFGALPAECAHTGRCPRL